MKTQKLLLTVITLMVTSGMTLSAEYPNVIDNEIYKDNLLNEITKSGAALRLNELSSQITNSVFDNNVVDNTKFSLGGAIYNTSAHLKIADSIFNSNKSINASDGNYGGAIFSDGTSHPATTNSHLIIENSEFTKNSVEGGKQINGGGAIAAQCMKDIIITNTKFNDNYAKGDSENSTKSSYVMGGAIAPSYVVAPIGPNYKVIQTLTINNSEFNRNYVTGEYKTYGGAIGSTAAMNIDISNSSFKENYIIGGTSAKGGAIGMTGKVDLNIKNSLFENNYIKDSTSAMGGVIYTQLSKVNIENTDFINNHIETEGSAYGGAITDIGSTINLKNSSFIGNYVEGSSTAGGAIYFQGNGASALGILNIIADGEDVEFTGNMANSISNAIYQSSNSRLNLNAALGNKIIFNDRIASSDTNTIMNINDTNLNYPTSGIIVLNESMADYFGEVKLHNGTLQLGEKGTFFDNASKFTSNDGATLDLQNGLTSSSIITNLVLNGTTNLKLDADFLDAKIDALKVNSSLGAGKFHITDIDILKDFSTATGNISLEIINNQSVQSTLENSLKTIFTSENKYDLSLNKNILTVDKSAYTGGLPGALASEGSRQYVLFENETVIDWGANGSQMQGDDFVVKGFSKSVLGEGNEGIVIDSSQNLDIVNVGSTNSNDEITGSWNNFHSDNGGAFYNDEGNLSIVDSIIANNTANNNGGAIFNDNGTVNIIADVNNVIFSGNKANGISNAIHNNGGTINLNSSLNKAIIFNDGITSENGSKNSTINVNASPSDTPTIASGVPNQGTVVLNSDMSGYKGDVNIYNGTIKVGENGTFFNAQNSNIYNCTIDFANGKIQDSSFGKLTISDHVNLVVDADLFSRKMDTISNLNKIADSGKISVDRINLISDATGKNISLKFAGDNLRETVNYNGSDTLYSPVFKYDVAYNKDTGDFDFTRFGNGPNNDDNYASFNPSVFAAPVAAQMGGYLSQLNSYDQAFMNIDMKMLLTRKERLAMKLQNKYATSSSDPKVFSPTFLRENERGIWARPYASFETVNLKGGPSVSNIMYGTFMGADSEMTELGGGYEGQLSLYAGYNGSHQTFDGNSIYQNGGNLGLTGVVYKGNFFSALTANAGASSVEAHTMYGSEQFPMLMAGIASKTGYNWELAEGKFIIQPNYLMSYTFVNAFDYTNAGGVKISSDPLNAIQIAPGIKLIANLKNGWQPYVSVSMVWNLMDETKFQAAAVSLPQLSVKPYIEYGVGIQKRWGERFTGFFQTMIRNGGRNGVALSFGFRWAIGK